MWKALLKPPGVGVGGRIRNDGASLPLVSELRSRLLMTLVLSYLCYHVRQHLRRAEHPADSGAWEHQLCGSDRACIVLLSTVRWPNRVKRSNVLSLLLEKLQLTLKDPILKHCCGRWVPWYCVYNMEPHTKAHLTGEGAVFHDSGFLPQWHLFLSIWAGPWILTCCMFLICPRCQVGGRYETMRYRCTAEWAGPALPVQLSPFTVSVGESQHVTWSVPTPTRDDSDVKAVRKQAHLWIWQKHL